MWVRQRADSQIASSSTVRNSSMPLMSVTGNWRGNSARIRKVQPIEKTNIRHLTPAQLKASVLNDMDSDVSIVVIDVSFISLRTVLPSVIKLVRSCRLSVISGQERSRQPSAVSHQQERVTSPENLLTDSRWLIADSHYDIIALLKPQFEAGKAYVKKGGIVSDKQVHIQTIENLKAFVTEKLGATVRGLTYSPIHRDIGNIEYLLWLTVDGERT